MTTVTVGSVSPVPSDEEAAAISAAVTLLWPQAAVPSADGGRTNVAWRFSGRWWASQHVVRRARPGF